MTDAISKEPDEDYATCADCGGDLETVRPGKHQHPGNYGAVCLELRETRRELQQLREENGRLRISLAQATPCTCLWRTDAIGAVRISGPCSRCTALAPAKETP